jgi:cytochrome P450 family 49 subfamily A
MNIKTAHFRLALRLPFWRLHGMQWKRFESLSVTKRSQEQMSPSTALPFNAIPGPTILENIVRFSRKGFRDYPVFLEKNFKRYGPIFKFVMPGVKVVHVCDPDDIERVYRNEGYPASRGDVIAASSYYREKGLPKGLNGGDESWYVQRSAVAPKLLRPPELRPFFGELCNVADDAIANFKDGRNLDISDQLAMLATENVAVLIFGVRFGLTGTSPNPKAREFADAVSGHFTAESKLLFSIPFHEYFKTPTLKELHRCLDKEWEIADHFIKKTSQRRPPLTSKCLVHRLAEEDKMSQKEILQITEGTFSGGVHTTSSTLIVLLHALSKQPKAQQKIYDEIQRVLQGGKQQPTYEQFLNMPYVKAFMKEVFRTQPSPLGNVRLLEKPIVLSGYRVPAGIRILVSAVATESMQEKSFGPDFGTFAPERWLRGSRNMHLFAALPFGFGPRMCIGRRFADMEMAVFLVRLLQKYEVVDSKLKEDQVEWYFNIIHTPTKPYNLTLKKRV